MIVCLGLFISRLSLPHDVNLKVTFEPLMKSKTSHIDLRHLTVRSKRNHHKGKTTERPEELGEFSAPNNQWTPCAIYKCEVCANSLNIDELKWIKTTLKITDKIVIF